MADVVMADATAEWDNDGAGGAQTAAIDDMPTTAAAGVELAWSREDEETIAVEAPQRSWGSVWAAVAVLGLLVTVAIAASWHVLRGRPAPTTTAPRPPAAATAAPRAPVLLDGTYRLDYLTGETTYRGHSLPPQRRAPAKTSWWAFRSSCSGAGCTAIGVRLDDVNHDAARIPSMTDTLNFIDGQWRDATPAAGHDENPCPGAYTDQWSFLPLADGGLRGTEMLTIVTDECGAKGNVTETPIAVTRVGAAPAALFGGTP